MWSNERPNTVFGSATELSIRVRTTNKTLGTTPGDPDLLGTYIASKAPDAVSMAEELANSYVDGVPDEEKTKMITVFPTGRFVRRKDDPTIFYDPLFGDYPPDGVEVEEVVVPFIWGYQFRGGFKEKIAFIQRASKAKPSTKKDGDASDDAEEAAPKKRGRKKAGEKAAEAAIAAGAKFACSDIKAYKKTVDGGWFVVQRRVPLLVPEVWVDDLGNEHKTYNENGRLPTWTRPLRASTAQGERTCIATSEFVPAGTEYYLTVRLLDPKHKKALIETLDFNAEVGMLQWRGGGHGTFVWTTADKNGKPTDEDLGI